MKKQDQILLEQAYDQVQVKENNDDAELNNAFNALQKSLQLFYALGQRGLNADADAANERIIDMLREQGVQDADAVRIGNALTSLVLQQSMQGHASRQPAPFKNAKEQAQWQAEEDEAERHERFQDSYS